MLQCVAVTFPDHTHFLLLRKIGLDDLFNLICFDCALHACADPENIARGGPILTIFMRGERIQIALKAGNYRPTSEMPKWRFAGGPMMPNIECWLSSLVNFRGSGPLLLRNPIFCNISGGVPPLDPRMA